MTVAVSSPCKPVRAEDHIMVQPSSGVEGSFAVWPELAAGKHEVFELPLCKVLLMDDINYPCWLVLVPRRPGLREVVDLPPSLQQQLWQEVALASQAIQELYRPFKVNIATLGNLVSQLHIHVTGRLQSDPSWPGPCYGAVPAKPLGDEAAVAMVAALKDYFATHSSR